MPVRSGEVADDYVDFWFYNGKEAGPLTDQPEAEAEQPGRGPASKKEVAKLRWRCNMCSDFLGVGDESDVHHLKKWFHKC